MNIVGVATEQPAVLTRFFLPDATSLHRSFGDRSRGLKQITERITQVRSRDNGLDAGFCERGASPPCADEFVSKEKVFMASPVRRYRLRRSLSTCASIGPTRPDRGTGLRLADCIPL